MPVIQVLYDPHWAVDNDYHLPRGRGRIEPTGAKVKEEHERRGSRTALGRGKREKFRRHDSIEAALIY